jgi:hypothetical protein
MMKWIIRGFLVAAVVLIAWWIGSKVFVSDETRVRRQLSAMTRYVEQGSLLRLSDGLAQDYSDDHGLDKATVIGAVRTYRAQFDALFVHLSDLTVTVDPTRKEAQAAFIAKVLARERGGTGDAELFSERFRVLFRKTDGDWLIYRAETPALKFD